jgi:hypothetical protein
MHRLRPPVHREDLGISKGFIADRLDPSPNPGMVNDAVAHHAAVKQKVTRWPEPIANMVGEEALAPSTGDAHKKTWVSPDMINVKRDAEQAGR